MLFECGGKVGLEVPDQLAFGAYRSVPNPWGEPLVFITGPQEIDEVGFADMFHFLIARNSVDR